MTQRTPNALRLPLMSYTLDGKRSLPKFNVRFWPKPDTIWSNQDAA